VYISCIACDYETEIRCVENINCQWSNDLVHASALYPLKDKKSRRRGRATASSLSFCSSNS